MVAMRISGVAGGILDEMAVLGAPRDAPERLAAQQKSDARQEEPRDDEYGRLPEPWDAEVRRCRNKHAERDNGHLFGHGLILLCFDYYHKLAALVVGVGLQFDEQLGRGAYKMLLVELGELAV